jgi:hypothetical protein
MAWHSDQLSHYSPLTWSAPPTVGVLKEHLIICSKLRTENVKESVFWVYLLHFKKWNTKSWCWLGALHSKTIAKWKKQSIEPSCHAATSLNVADMWTLNYLQLFSQKHIWMYACGLYATAARWRSNVAWKRGWKVILPHKVLQAMRRKVEWCEHSEQLPNLSKEITVGTMWAL